MSTTTLYAPAGSLRNIQAIHRAAAEARDVVILLPPALKKSAYHAIADTHALINDWVPMGPGREQVRLTASFSIFTFNKIVRDDILAHYKQIHPAFSVVVLCPERAGPKTKEAIRSWGNAARQSFFVATDPTSVEHGWVT